ncbi:MULTISPECIES: ATP synthase F1 subunit delta [Commensalibacter]|uniref:ATP synthase F1 subunit delta n=1 Tax=Commensalibacter TaxID=1079922 RepID=UPI000EFBE103|nr:ATP synthase F1 subunit delta [Commensalibacter melissae]MBH9969004.1 ATP synthase F1 subunit delta [Commensalibacter sp. M0265]MBH9976360.1 ATP synthase F1 subunit delta [Commensalibacter sp. M0266]MBH9992704.1 ATP synthase F1 subunit delta [Commensalibacter sp. M0270]MBI0015969.1 ATP synthase F1 subunit delta [Commensalibacter sp. B14384M2]MBI0017720.1 ATP synthase F1 subunit delta [Commensalibacter sp. W8133]MBI0045536.1 ATP synthase F1 subunit delta [Commensalibacter sp. M0267]MBI0048
MNTDATHAALAASAFTANNLKGRYATALYEFAEEQHALNEVIAEAEGLLKIISENETLRNVLNNPSLDTVQSKAIMAELMNHCGFSQILQNFVGVVANNRRLADLKSFLMAFFALVNLRRGITAAEVITASPLTDMQRAQLKDRFSQAGYNKVDIQERIDSKILGGIIVRIGSKLYDASLQSRLNRLYNVMKGAA